MRTILLTLVFLAAPAYSEPVDFTVYGPKVDTEYKFDLSAFLPVDRLRLEEIRNHAALAGTYEDFLDFLAERRPSLLKNSVLVHDSGSLQYADLKQPRVILFGDGLMLSFAENPNRNDRSVEIIAFDEDTKNFQFAELEFGSEGARFHKDPDNCRTCHGSPGKPLWDPYDFWPNVYGSSIARFGTVAEKNAYKALRAENPKKGIYDRLTWPSSLPGKPHLENNETFTEYSNQLQTVSRLARWKRETPAFAKAVPALLAVTNSCVVAENDELAASKLAAYFPASWARAVASGFPARHRQVQEDRRRFKTYQQQRYQALFPNSPKLFAVNHQRLAFETQTVAQLFFVFDLVGIDASDFALSQGLNGFLMSAPSNHDADLASTFAFVAQDLFQKLKPKLISTHNTNYSWLRFDCEALKEESRRLLGDQKPAVAAPRATAVAPTVLGECMSCHSRNPEALGVPRIPFDRTGELKRYLTKEGGLDRILSRIEMSGAGRMPPYRNLSPDEQAQLRDNLEKIGAQ